MPKPKLEEYIRMKDAGEVMYRIIGIKRGLATFYNWMKDGRRGADGKTVKLKATKRLGQWYTTKKWIEEFLREAG